MRASASIRPTICATATTRTGWPAEKLLVERGLVSAEELASGRASGPADEAVRDRVLQAEKVGPGMAKGSPVEVALDTPPRFAVGDRVRAINRHPAGHTREPRYVRGRPASSTRTTAHVFPDLSALGQREGRHLYSVRFEAGEALGEAAAAGGAVYVDLWEDYLEPAG